MLSFCKLHESPRRSIRHATTVIIPHRKSGTQILQTLALYYPPQASLSLNAKPFSPPFHRTSGVPFFTSESNRRASCLKIKGSCSMASFYGPNGGRHVPAELEEPLFIDRVLHGPAEPVVDVTRLVLPPSAEKTSFACFQLEQCKRVRAVLFELLRCTKECTTGSSRSGRVANTSEI